MSGYCKYYKQKKQVSYDNGLTWTDTGDYQKGDLYEINSTDCGYIGIMYRWINLNPSTDYYCSGTTKYYKQQKQVSYDGGSTWSNVSPTEYKVGSIYEINSVDCGYEPPSGYSTQYLTFVALEDGTFKFSGTAYENTVQYSLDSGETWTRLSNNDNSPTVTTGNEIWWKGTMTPTYYDGIGTFTSTGSFNIEGNIMSLIYEDNFIDKTSLSGKSHVFKGLFEDCIKIINAENLVLPARTLSQGCYQYMFHGCYGLTTIPILPATIMEEECYYCMFWECISLTTIPSNYLPAVTLAPYCYFRMFGGCTSLTTAPQLPATTLAESCYERMFYGCTSLTTAPTLPATALTDYCYSDMFYGCTSLTTAPTLPATSLASRCYSGMFRGCTSLTTAPSLPATTLANRCYYTMFYCCTSLTTAPTLPATTLASGCYVAMFYGCTSLTTAPTLPATTLADSCYYCMFQNCTSLNSITCLATDISASYATNSWLNGVASSGTFVKNASMTSWPRTASGIPSNWTIQDA